MAADYTSSIYSLVVIVSATLALSSYLLNHANAQMSATKGQLESDWKKHCAKLASGETSDDGLKEEYDKIINQIPIGVELYIGILVALLPASALLQVVEVAIKAWGHDTSQTATDILSWVDEAIPFVIIVGYLIAFAVVILVMQKIRRFRNLNETMKDTAQSLINKGKLAVSQYELGLKHKEGK